MHPPQVFHLTDPVGPIDHVLGPEHATVTLVEYGDFECPYCKQAAPAVKLLLDRFGEQIRFVFRPFPLEEVHPNALHAAEAAECAGAQGKFWQMHDLLFEHQSHLHRKDLIGYAEQLALDMPRFIAAMDDEIYRQRIREHQRNGQYSGVRATPTFFLNDRIQDVSFGLRALVDSVEAALKRGPA